MWPHNALANRKEAKRKHMECGPKRVREDEQCMQDLVACMHEFNSFPFNPVSPTLCTLQSAMPASDEFIVNFNSARAVAEEKLTSFLQDQAFLPLCTCPSEQTLDVCQGAMHGEAREGTQGESF
ncbi:unnamed protein product [Merluccius merluccius]